MKSYKELVQESPEDALLRMKKGRGVKDVKSLSILLKSAEQMLKDLISNKSELGRYDEPKLDLIFRNEIYQPIKDAINKAEKLAKNG